MTLSILAAVPASAAPTPKKKTEEPLYRQYLDAAKKVQEPVSHLYLQTVGASILTVEAMHEIDTGKLPAKEKYSAIIISLNNRSQELGRTHSVTLPPEIRSALGDFEDLYNDSGKIVIDTYKNQRRVVALSNSNWMEEMLARKKKLDTAYFVLVQAGQLPLTPAEAAIVGRFVPDYIEVHSKSATAEPATAAATPSATPATGLTELPALPFATPSPSFESANKELNVPDYGHTRKLVLYLNKDRTTGTIVIQKISGNDNLPPYAGDTVTAIDDIDLPSKTVDEIIAAVQANRALTIGVSTKSEKANTFMSMQRTDLTLMPAEKNQTEEKK